jgi:hypothetical protein
VIRTWYLVHLQSKVLAPAAEAFLRFMREHAEQHLQRQDQELLRSASRRV